jgi:hypothetical protein
LFFFSFYPPKTREDSYRVVYCRLNTVKDECRTRYDQPGAGTGGKLAGGRGGIALSSSLLLLGRLSSSSPLDLLSDTDDKRAALDLLLVHGIQSLLLVFAVLELNEAEALATTVALDNDVSAAGGG